MWPRAIVRYAPLADQSPPGIKSTLVGRGSILIIVSVFALAIIAGTTLKFDLQFAFTSKQSDIVSPEALVGSVSSPVPTTALYGPGDTPDPSFSKEHLSIEEIKAMVSQTKGFYTRDYSLGLGWNNVRYIIEAAALQARLLNRTLILPSFVYARSCAYDIAVCADEAPMVNRGEAMGWDAWLELPIEQQMGWQLPLSMMLNITQLRRFQPVVTTAEYLAYAGLPPTLATTSGFWNRSAEYYQTASGPSASGGDGKPSLFVIENAWYDPDGVTRVDGMPEAVKVRGGWVAGDAGAVQAGRWEGYDNGTAPSLLRSLLLDKNVVDWDEATSAVRDLAVQLPESVDASSTDLEDDGVVERVLNQHGWEVLYTFRGAAGMDFVKHIVLPIRQVALRTSIRGFVEDYHMIDADVVVLAGETHLYRKPGQMRFTTPSMREWFQRLVLHHIVPLDKVYALAKKFDFRISTMNQGRQWMAAHIRRGDFVSVGWAWGGDSHERHLERIKKHLDDGQKLLQSKHRHATYSVPDITPDPSIPPREPPVEGDKFFIATDETDPEKLDYFSKHGAIMFQDLVTFEDRHEFGWGILFSDIVGLVEQATLARASYFYGAAMSSFTGGVFNMRAVLGAEEVTALAD